MSEIESFPSVGPSVIQVILLVDQFTRPNQGYRFVASSLPGHLIQLVVLGETEHEANGRRYHLSPAR